MEQTIRLAQEIAEKVIREAGQIARVHFDQITCAVERTSSATL